MEGDTKECSLCGKEMDRILFCEWCEIYMCPDCVDMDGWCPECCNEKVVEKY